MLSAQCDREKMVMEYQTLYQSSQVTDLGWTGDADKCSAGETSPQALQKTLDRINYFRHLVGLTTTVSIDTSLTKMCQEAALMMHRNNQLDHFPDSSWLCFSGGGRTAAGKSNLALGAHSANAIDLYMFDPGTNNWAVGHRRWILYTRAKDIGLGSTPRANAMYVIHNKIPAPGAPAFIAYPSPSYFPAPLMPDRWSLSVPGANFSSAEVGMTDQEGREVPVMVNEIKNGFGDNTIVWEPDRMLIRGSLGTDRSYDIVVAGIVRGTDTFDVSYQTIIAPVSHPPACQEGERWSDAACSCVSAIVTSTRSTPAISPVSVFPNPSQGTFRIDLPESTAAEMMLYDLTGRLVARSSQVHRDQPIDVSNLPTGLYVGRIQQGKKIHSFKLNLMH